MSRFRKFVKSKIQGLHITGKELQYEGSLELDEELLSAADILFGEMVQVVNVNNGKRFETYVIPGKAGSGSCVLKGGAARLGEVGDELIVMSMIYLGESDVKQYNMIKVSVDANNRIR
ncbi:MAG: aspartate 1-decarboxylase [bacterium]